MTKTLLHTCCAPCSVSCIRQLRAEGIEKNEVDIFSWVRQGDTISEIIDKGVITTTSVYNGNTNEKSQFFMRLETVYRFVNTEKPDEFVDVTTYGDGIDNGDKAPGKAMTYSDKYALLKAYKIITGDDPDQQGSEERGFRSEAARRKAVGKCTDCGHAIADVGNWKAEQIAESTEKTYGVRLCWACAAKRKKAAALEADAAPES